MTVQKKAIIVALSLMVILPSFSSAMYASVSTFDSVSFEEPVKKLCGETVVKTALQYIGSRYRRGASRPGAFDCSGFTSYVYRQLNVPITRTSRSQYTEGQAVKVADLQKGDLVFFGGSRSRRSVGHVGIVTEVNPDGQTFKFVHASCSSGVKVDNSTNPYYVKRFIGARRLIDTE